MTSSKPAKNALGDKKFRYFEAPVPQKRPVATPPKSWGRIKPHGSIRLPKGEAFPYIYCPWSLQSLWTPPDYWYYRPVRSIWVPRGVVPKPNDGLTYVFAGKGQEGNWYGVWQLVSKRGNPTVLTLGPSEPRRWQIKPRRHTSTPVRTKNHRRYITEAPRWGNAEDDFDPLPHFPQHHMVGTMPLPSAGEVLYHVEQHRMEADAKPLTAAEEVLYHVERHRVAFQNLFTDWNQGKPLELGPPTFPTNIFEAEEAKLAMFWAKRLKASKYPELNINCQWRRAGLKEATYDPVRKSKWITKARKRCLNRAHYLNGLVVLTPHLTALPKMRLSYRTEKKVGGRWRTVWVAPPIVLLPSWTFPLDVVSYSGEKLKQAGERINLGSEAAEDAARVIARQRTLRRQLEAVYTLAGYVSATTGKTKGGLRTELTRALESVDYSDYKISFRKPKDDHDSFRAALDLELPGAIYLAAHDGRPEDRERGIANKDLVDDVILDRYRLSARAYNERLRKLGYRDWDGKNWKTHPEDNPLPEPLESEISRLAKDARLWITHTNRRCRTDFSDVVKVCDRDERRKLAPDTRSEETAKWQLWDRKHQPDPAEYDIEIALAEGDIEIAGSAYAAEAAAKERSWKYEFQGMETLAVNAPEPDEEGEAEDDYSPDFDTHYSLNFCVDAQGKKHLLRLEFPQREAVESFREYAFMDSLEPEKYATAYKKGTLPEYERQQLYPSYRVATLLDLLGKRRLPEIDEQDDAVTFVRYEDEETGERHTLKTSKLTDLRHELDGEGPSRFGLTERQREVFGSYYGTSDMTIADIAKKLKVSEITVKREMKGVRERLAQAGVPLPAQGERRGRKAA
jgi:hypothetical protein